MANTVFVVLHRLMQYGFSNNDVFPEGDTNFPVADAKYTEGVFFFHYLYADLGNNKIYVLG